MKFPSFLNNFFWEKFYARNVFFGLCYAPKPKYLYPKYMEVTLLGRMQRWYYDINEQFPLNNQPRKFTLLELASLPKKS